MTTTIEVYAGDFFILIETKPNIKLCEVCNKDFKRTAFYRHIKSNFSCDI